MRYTAVTCSPRISGMAAKAGVDVNQPRAMGNTTGSSSRRCATENRRLAGSGIGVTTGGRRATLKAQQGAFRAEIRGQMVPTFQPKITLSSVPSHYWPCEPFSFRLGLSTPHPTPRVPFRADPPQGYPMNPPQGVPWGKTHPKSTYPQGTPSSTRLRPTPTNPPRGRPWVGRR
jgi:hypothetical protein